MHLTKFFVRVLKARYVVLFFVATSQFFALSLDWTNTAHANDTRDVSIHLVALFDGKAMLAINGKRAKIVTVGESHNGVKLLSANTSEASIEFNGQRDRLTLDGTAILSTSLGTKPPSNTNNTVQLWSNDGGFFLGEGSIDGQALEFMIDTGANIVVLSAVDATRIGLEYEDQQRGRAVTASGVAPMYLMNVAEISLGSIRLRGIEVGVMEGDFPKIPLLGMSFLKHLEMQRSGNKMTLKKR